MASPDITTAAAIRRSLQQLLATSPSTVTPPERVAGGADVLGVDQSRQGGAVTAESARTPLVTALDVGGLVSEVARDRALRASSSWCRGTPPPPPR